MSDQLTAAAQAMNVPEPIVERSARARAEASGSSYEEVLAAWAGGQAVAASAPAPVAEEAPPPTSEPEPEAPAEQAPAAPAAPEAQPAPIPVAAAVDRKSTRLNSSHVKISYAVFCLKKKNR